MKKDCKTGGLIVSGICHQMRKILIIMKLSLIIVLLSLFSAGASVYSQNSKLKLDYKNASIREVLNAIEDQSEFRFAFSSEYLDLDKKVSVRFENESITTILDDIFKDGSVRYSINDRMIILYKNENSGKISAQPQTITGKVTDSSGAPLPGVSIVLKGTTQGVITNTDGNYSLANVPGNAILVYSFVGMKTQEVNVNNQPTINIVMREETVGVGEIVVTALGIKRSEKTLGYATQEVKGESLEKVKGQYLATSMTGHISGMTVYNSTEFLDSPDISLRGETPILVVNGVLTALSLGELNSDDIESINILKGPTASALYGSRGGSGAIIVTTKSGAKAQGLEVTVNSSNMFALGDIACPEQQTSYSSGYGGEFNNDDYVWGDKMDIGKIYNQWNPITKEYEDRELVSAGKNNWQNFRRNSIITNNTVSIAQSGKFGSYRSSISFIYNQGQFPNSDGKQFHYTVGGEAKLGEKVNLAGNLTFTKQTAPNIASQTYNAQGYMYNLLVWTGAEYDVRDFKDYWVKKDEKQNWMYTGWYDNPYLMAYEKINKIDNNAINGTMSLDFHPYSWLKATWRGGVDYKGNTTIKRAPIGINSTRHWGDTSLGWYDEEFYNTFDFNGDFMLNATKKAGDFNLDILLGSSVYYYNYRYLTAETTGGLSVPGYYSLNASVDAISTNTGFERKLVNSLYGKFSVSYKDIAFLDITGRNDWSSTLPSNDNSYFYPSTSLSVVMSEFLSLPDWMKFWKIRGSWTISKSDLGIYDINQGYTVTKDVWDGASTAEYTSSIRGNVKPITNRTWEVGTAFSLFEGNRLKLDMAYFQKLTYNMTTEVGVSALSGFSSKLMNTDEEYIRKGFELTVAAIPVQTKDFTWRTTTNWSRSPQYYHKLDADYTEDRPWIKVGRRTDAFTDTKILDRASDGTLILSNGLPVRRSGLWKIGNADPDWTWGWSNSFEYKNWTLGISIDGRIGGMSESETSWALWKSGSHPDSDNKYRYQEVVEGVQSGYVYPGYQVVSGGVTYDDYGDVATDTRVLEKNTVGVGYEQFYHSSKYKDGEQWDLSDTFFKLRELSLSYNIPERIISKLQMKSATFSLIGQNLLLWTKSREFDDPDNAYDSLCSPSVRLVGVNVRIGF